jgi:hypothetical protein
VWGFPPAPPHVGVPPDAERLLRDERETQVQLQPLALPLSVSGLALCETGCSSAPYQWGATSSRETDSRAGGFTREVQRPLLSNQPFATSC